MVAQCLVHSLILTLLPASFPRGPCPHEGASQRVQSTVSEDPGVLGVFPSLPPSWCARTSRCASPRSCALRGDGRMAKHCVSHRPYNIGRASTWQVMASGILRTSGLRVARVRSAKYIGMIRRCSLLGALNFFVRSLRRVLLLFMLCSMVAIECLCCCPWSCQGTVSLLIFGARCRRRSAVSRPAGVGAGVATSCPSCRLWWFPGVPRTFAGLA